MVKQILRKSILPDFFFKYIIFKIMSGIEENVKEQIPIFLLRLSKQDMSNLKTEKM